MRSAPLRSAPPRAPDSTRCSQGGGVSFLACARRPSAVREARPCPDSRVDAVALALAPGVGPRSYRQLMERFGSAPHALSGTVSRAEVERLRREASRMVADGDACRARLLLLGDPDYPAPLLELTDPPPFLFSYGDLSLLGRPAVAIVGTR